LIGSSFFPQPARRPNPIATLKTPLNNLRLAFMDILLSFPEFTLTCSVVRAFVRNLAPTPLHFFHEF
jgi:hypothetical protein